MGRRPYAIWGLALFAVKYNLDRWVASGIFHREWFITRYFHPIDGLATLREGGTDTLLCATLLVLALPFIGAGIWLSVRRLTDLGLPPALALLFFVPFVNLFLFGALSFLPTRSVEEGEPGRRRSALRVSMPEGRLGAAAMAILITVPIFAAAVYVEVEVLETYATGLFVGLPFVLGFLASFLYGAGHARDFFPDSVGVALLAVAILAGLLFALFVEGIVCIAMAAPIGITLAVMGSAFGWKTAQLRWEARGGEYLAIGLVAALASQMGLDSLAPPPPIHRVHTEIEVGASPDRVWNGVVHFPPIPVTDDWVFRAGIASPLRAEIDGTGVGATRRCVFTTGTFVEPIEVWDPPRVLAFGVTEQPPTLEEWNPFGEIHPPHLEGTFVSERGEFRMTALPGGRTLLEGTTWYRNRMWPTFYWSLWSDAIVHRIHLRVLRHVKRLAETDPS
jgi:uncharacterized membrane protein YhaH (DUF805 family)